MQTIIVYGESRTVSVDGRTFPVVLPEGCWKGLRILRWDAANEDWPGHETRDNNGCSFRDFERIRPFVDAWQRASSTDDERQAAVEAERAAEAHRHRVEELKAVELREAQHPIVEAHAYLAQTDWRIVRAMEAKLSAAGELDPALVEEREARRETIRQNRGETA